LGFSQIVVRPGQNVGTVTRRTLKVPGVSRLPDIRHWKMRLAASLLGLRRSASQAAKYDSVTGTVVFDFQFQGCCGVIK